MLFIFLYSTSSRAILVLFSNNVFDDYICLVIYYFGRSIVILLPKILFYFFRSKYETQFLMLNLRRSQYLRYINLQYNKKENNIYFSSLIIVTSDDVSSKKYKTTVIIPMSGLYIIYFPELDDL